MPTYLDSPCTIWSGAKNNMGYGIYGGSHSRERGLVHRRAYIQEVGPIPEGLVLDHLCRNTACYNTAHLEPVTQRENILRGNAPEQVREHWTARAVCARGHLLTENLRVTPPGGKRKYLHRRCAACGQENSRKHYWLKDAQR
mgnify:FL=1